MKRVGMILSGCGHQDGAEIHESVIAILALERLGCEVSYFAPDKAQAKVQDHIKHEPMPERRNVLREAARIARGQIKPLSEFTPELLDGVVLPGGFGAALNLCTFAQDGAAMEVDALLADKLRAAHKLGKPIAAICIAPVILAKVFAEQKPLLTLGSSEDDAAVAIEKMGAKHVACSAADCVVDERLRFVSTPAYMLGKRPKDIAPGIEKAAAALVRMLG